MRIDLNADMGESFGNWRLGDDEALLGIVSSANVACGFHAGDPEVMLRTCRYAAEHQVSVGAQISYRDLAGFGRNFIDVPEQTLYAEVLYQISALAGIAASVGTQVSYVKPHGALYNTVVHHEEQARAIVSAVADFDRDLTLLGLPGSLVLKLAAEAGIRTVREAFADRAYTAEATLVSRRHQGAVLHDPREVSARMVRLVTQGTITTVDGNEVEVDAHSICVHGDSPGAVEMATQVRRALTDAGVEIRAFVDPPGTDVPVEATIETPGPGA